MAWKDHCRSGSANLSRSWICAGRDTFPALKRAGWAPIQTVPTGATATTRVCQARHSGPTGAALCLPWFAMSITVMVSTRRSTRTLNGLGGVAFLTRRGPNRAQLVVRCLAMRRTRRSVRRAVAARRIAFVVRFVPCSLFRSCQHRPLVVRVRWHMRALPVAHQLRRFSSGRSRSPLIACQGSSAARSEEAQTCRRSRRRCCTSRKGGCIVFTAAFAIVNLSRPAIGLEALLAFPSRPRGARLGSFPAGGASLAFLRQNASSAGPPFVRLSSWRARRWKPGSSPAWRRQ